MNEFVTALDRVQSFLKGYPDLQVVLFDSSTHTAEAAANTLGVAVGQIAKSLIFLADENPVLIVTCGDKKINTKKFAKTLCAKKIKFADAPLVSSLTGFEPGGVSPVGLLHQVPIYLDRSLYDYPVVYAAAGTDNSALPVKPSRLQEITKAEIVDVSQ